MISGMDDIMKQIEERNRRLGEARAPNAKAIFDALATAGITSVVVEFDGSGDSGQIEGRTALAGALEAKLPSVDVDYTDVGYDGNATTAPIDLTDAIDNVVYAVLEETHGGWENNDGAYGDVTFNVAERTFHLDYNERFTDSTHYDHDFSADGAEGLDIPENERGFT